MPRSLMVHRVDVETFRGRTGSGTNRFDAPRTRRGLLDETTTTVVNATGDEVVSSARFLTDTEAASLFVPGSRVTPRHTGRPLVVVKTRTPGRGVPGAPAHLEVSLA